MAKGASGKNQDGSWFWGWVMSLLVVVAGGYVSIKCNQYLLLAALNINLRSFWKSRNLDLELTHYKMKFFFFTPIRWSEGLITCTKITCWFLHFFFACRERRVIWKSCESFYDSLSSFHRLILILKGFDLSRVTVKFQAANSPRISFISV